VSSLQQEIAEASNDAARKYYDEIPADERSTSEVTALMRAAAKTKHQSFKGQFSKYTAVANPKFGDEFLQEVRIPYHHFCQFLLMHIWTMINLLSPFDRSQSIGATMSNNEKPEMSLEKLQLIATASASSLFKVRWLRFWNLGLHSRQAVHFPSKGFSERDLDS
jgi:hypothetical protein